MTLASQLLPLSGCFKGGPSRWRVCPILANSLALLRQVEVVNVKVVSGSLAPSLSFCNALHRSFSLSFGIHLYLAGYLLVLFI